MRDSDQMTDEQLHHLCKLAVIAVAMIDSPEFDPRDHGCQSEGDVKNLTNVYRILARAFVVLMKRQGISPVFRVDALSSPAELAPSVDQRIGQLNLIDT